MRAIIGRVAAVIVGGLCVWVASIFGVEVTDEARGFLTDGLTFLGMGIWLLAYPIVHKLINRRLNPADAAKPEVVPIAPAPKGL